MKILFPIGTLYPSQAGGPSNTIYWMAKALVQQGVGVTLVTTDIGATDKVVSNNWLSTDYGNAIYYSGQKNQFPLRMMWTAARLIAGHDCIHLNSLFYPPSFLLAAIAIWKNKAVIWSCRGNLHPQAMMYSQWKKRPVLWLIKTFLSGPQVCFHATSLEESAHIKQLLGASIRLVELPNYLEIHNVQARSLTNTPYFLYVGRLHPIKALDRLIEALRISRPFQSSGFLLKIAGEGDPAYVSQLKKQIDQHGLQAQIQFLGLIEGLAKQQLYADAYFTLLPSHSENFGNVVVESLAQATPVIASTGTPWALLEQEQAGFWVDNDPDALSAAIDQALNLSPEKYQDYRDQALELARHFFDIHENIGKWVDVYQQAINYKSIV